MGYKGGKDKTIVEINKAKILWLLQNLVNTQIKSHSFELFCPSCKPILGTDIVDGTLLSAK